MATAGITILVFYHHCQDMHITWRLSISRLNLLVADLQMNCSDLINVKGCLSALQRQYLSNMTYLVNLNTIKITETTTFPQQHCTWNRNIGHAFKHRISVDGCQPDEPLSSLVTTNRIINVYVFIVVIVTDLHTWMEVCVIVLLMYSVLRCLYSVGNNITTTTRSWVVLTWPSDRVFIK